MDKIWVETLERISELEKRLALIEEIAQEPLKELKAKKVTEPPVEIMPPLNEPEQKRD